MTLTDYFSAIAYAIRKRDGTTEPIVAIDFPQRILDIPSDGVNLSYGTFTPTQNTNTASVEHGLNVIPNFAIVYIFDDVSSFSVSGLNILVADFEVSNGYKHYEIRSEWKNPRVTTSNEQLFVYSDTDIIFNLNEAPFWSGKNYVWICGRIDG